MQKCDVQKKKIVTKETKNFLQKVREKVTVALIGGSPLYRIKEKLGNDGKSE